MRVRWGLCGQLAGRAECVLAGDAAWLAVTWLETSAPPLLLQSHFNRHKEKTLPCIHANAGCDFLGKVKTDVTVRCCWCSRLLPGESGPRSPALTGLLLMPLMLMPRPRPL
jgi:hypothetical protein